MAVLNYNSLLAGSDLHCEYAGDTVVITALAGEPIPEVVRAVSLRSAITAALGTALWVAGCILLGGIFLIGGGRGVHADALVGLLLLVFAGAIFVGKWRGQYRIALAMARTVRQQATVLCLMPDGMRIESDGALGAQVRGIERAFLDDVRIERGSSRWPQPRALWLEIRWRQPDGAVAVPIVLFHGRERFELLWIRSHVRNWLDVTPSDAARRPGVPLA